MLTASEKTMAPLSEEASRLSLSEFVHELLFKCQLLGSTEIVYSVESCSPRRDS